MSNNKNKDNKRISKKDFDTLYRAMSVFSDIECQEDLKYYTYPETKEILLFINCNDFFHWACSDMEEITSESISVLEEAVKEMKEKIIEIGEQERDYIFLEWVGLYFCCKNRKMRPQGACYTTVPPELHSLFDSCGPERKIDIFNPQSNDGKYLYKEEKKIN